MLVTPENVNDGQVIIRGEEAKINSAFNSNEDRLHYKAAKSIKPDFIARKLCEEKGYVKPEALAHIYTKDSMLNMPSMTKEEIRGLMRTFVLYARMPKSLWDEIALAEEDNIAGNEKYLQLMEILTNQKNF